MNLSPSIRRGQRRVFVCGALGVLACSSAAYAASTMSTPAAAPSGARFALSISADAEPTEGSSSARAVVIAGRSQRLQLSLSPKDGFSGRAGLSVRGVPRGARVRLSRRSLSGPARSATLTVSTARSMARKTFSIVVQARGVGGVRRVRARVSVRYLRVLPTTATVVAGQRVTTRLALRRTSKRAPTRLSVVGLPTGTAAVFSPVRTAGSSAALTISTAATVRPGSYPLTIVSRWGRGGRSSARLTLRVTDADVRAPFAISGSTDGLLPGLTRPIELRLVGNSSHDLRVTALSVKVASVTAPNATAALPCGPGDFTVTQYTGPALALPRGQARTLSALGVTQTAWPAVTMLNRPVNQDGCKGATVNFTYTGSATR